MTLMFLAVGLGLIILLSRRFIRPITELARTMEKAGGDRLDVQVDIKGEDEIALLGRSFNRMIERIRSSNTKVKQTHKELIQFVGAIERTGADVLDKRINIDGCGEISLLCYSFNEMIDRIRESNLELKKTHEKLLHSQKLASLGTLASGVAHEINNPLGGMFNCVELLEKKGEDEEFRKRYLELIKDGLSRIESTVGNLLWMSRKKESIPKSVEIKQLLKNAYVLTNYLVKKNNVVYRENIEDQLSVVIDPHDLQRVMMNLIINAVQSMKKGGMLSINAFRKNGKVILEVSDTGEGIGEESLDKIFTPFFTTKQPGEGTGLGLWLTHEIVENYNGEISVKSKKGEGSKFSIIFNSG
jgi:signal transduction histidine kinase